MVNSETELTQPSSPASLALLRGDVPIAMGENYLGRFVKHTEMKEKPCSPVGWLSRLKIGLIGVILRVCWCPLWACVCVKSGPPGVKPLPQHVGWPLFACVDVNVEDPL